MLLKKQAFTLIELVMVIMILGILSAYIIPKYWDVKTTMSVSVTKAELNALVKAIMGDTSTGLNGFFTDMGRYPDNNEGLQVLLDSTGLTSGSATFNPITQKGWNGPYVDNLDNDNNGVSDILEDAWGNGYVYNVTNNTILSMGPNGVNDSGGADDIVVYFGN